MTVSLRVSYSADGHDVGLRSAQDYAEAVKWYRKAAEQGDAGRGSRWGELRTNTLSRSGKDGLNTSALVRF